MQGSIRKIVGGSVFFLITCSIAVAAYLASGWSLLDAIYMVIITVFGVGYGEIRPVEDPSLRVLTILLIVLGCSSLICITGGFTQMITEGELDRALGKHRQNKHIDRMSGHAIICGFGRVGRVLTAALKAEGQAFVVVDSNHERVVQADELGYKAVQDDASEEDVLECAGVKRARVLATVLPEDTLNVFITLSARDLNPNLEIIARAENPATEKKLKRSGADRIVLPSAIGADRIAHLITCPSAEAVLELDSQKLGESLETVGLKMHEVHILADSPLAGESIGDALTRSLAGLLIVAIVRPDGTIIRDCSKNEVLQVGDGLTVLGHAEDVAKAVKRVGGELQMLYCGARH
jgi:voltage-gated potassium channel